MSDHSSARGCRTPSTAAIVRADGARLSTLTCGAAGGVPLLQRVTTCLYVALCDFVATSVFIGIDSVWHLDVSWLSVLLAIMGVVLLLIASVYLILESRVALTAVDHEMRFVKRLGEGLVPADARELPRARRGNPHS